MSEPEWRRVNRANLDERVGIHLGPRGYDLSDLRAGHRRLHAIEEAELPSVGGQRILHLQCHFGADSLTLAQRGAEVVGLDFSGPAIDAARVLAAELGLADQARISCRQMSTTLCKRSLLRIGREKTGGNPSSPRPRTTSSNPSSSC